METRNPRAASLMRASTVLAALILALLFDFLPSAASGKDLGASGVFLFQGPAGPAYVQFTGLFLNGKMELRACGSSPRIAKSDYKSAAKLTFAGIASLERLPDGGMAAQSSDGQTQCVLPGNFKWEKEDELSVKELIEKSSILAQVSASQPPGRVVLPAFAPGSKIYLVSPTDVELAEFLRADWAPSIDLWRAYLDKYPAGSPAHLAEAKKSLEGLLVADGRVQLDNYRKSPTATPDYDALKNSFLRVAESVQLVPAEAGAAQLAGGIAAALKAITENAQAHLAAYKTALADRKPGYPNLPEARRLADAITGIDSQYAPGIALLADAMAQQQAYDKMLTQARTSFAGKQYDEAAKILKPYLAFREEEPRLKDLAKQVYDYYIDSGAQSESAEKWEDAIRLYQSALGVIETADAAADLARAKAGAHTAENKTAAASAVARSQSFIEAKDYIRAYQTLLTLTKEQQALVTDQLDAVRPSYIQAATERAAQLKKTNTPLRGRGNEDALREAYDYLESVYELNSDEDVKLHRDLIADELSAYYVDLAKNYIRKPVGTGIGVGWNYLSEASVYTPNKPEIRDAQTTARATYQMRSRLSIKIEFHDQTSRRDSEGFSTQLQNAIAQDLETAGMGVRVILPDSAPGIDPNYILLGQIVEHRDKKTEGIETLKSHYVSGTHDVRNPEWVTVDEQYEQAVSDYEKYNNDFREAQAKSKKTEMDEAGKQMALANQKKLELHTKLNSIPEHLQQDTILEYSYAQHNIDIVDIVDISYRITDMAGNPIGEAGRITRNDPHKFTVLEGLNAADHDGVHAKDAPPVEAQLQTDSDDAARNDLVLSAHGKVHELPAKILAKASELASTEDFDAAGEQYILYLNCTAAGDTPERQEASKFLADRFNLRHTLDLSASAR